MAMIPEGLYRGKVVGWGFDNWQNADKTPFFFVTLRLFASVPDNGGEPVELENTVQRMITMPLTTKSLDLTLSRLRDHFGFDDPDLEKLHPDHDESFDLQGKEVLVAVRHGTYTDRNNKERPKEDIFLQRESTRLRREELAPLKDLFAVARERQEEIRAKKAAQEQEEADQGDGEPSQEAAAEGEKHEEPAPAPKRQRKKVG